MDKPLQIWTFISSADLVHVTVPTRTTAIPSRPKIYFEQAYFPWAASLYVKLLPRAPSSPLQTLA